MVDLRVLSQLRPLVHRAVVGLRLLRQEHELAIVVSVRDDDHGAVAITVARARRRREGFVHDGLVGADARVRPQRHEVRVGVLARYPFAGWRRVVKRLWFLNFSEILLLHLSSPVSEGVGAAVSG